MHTSVLRAEPTVELWAIGLGHRTLSQMPWTTLSAPYRFEYRPSINISQIDRLAILHIICEVVEGAGGLEIRLSKNTSAELETSGIINTPRGFSARTITRLQDGPPRLCVLQGFPLAQPGRSPTDRYCAGLLRRAAAELFDAGVGAVLVIPSVPETIAVRVIQPVVRAVARARKRGADALMKAVREIQEIIGDDIG
jgi:hypothetical protein